MSSAFTKSHQSSELRYACSLVEAHLKCYVLENEEGIFRWYENYAQQKPLSSTYCFEFRRQFKLIGFRMVLKSSIAMALRQTEDGRLVVDWNLYSLADIAMCKEIIQETQDSILAALSDAAVIESAHQVNRIA